MNPNDIPMFKKNVGGVDRGIRLGAALIIAALYTLGAIDGVIAIVLGIVAVVLVVTSFMSYCPAYSILKISTREDVN